MRLRSCVTANIILHVPQHDCEASVKSATGAPTLIFFVSGNPGLIAYYEQFLELLAHHDEGVEDSTTKGAERVILVGYSLGGFEINDSGAQRSSTDDQADSRNDEDPEREALISDLMFPPSYQKKSIYGLNDQVDLCYARLQHLTQRIQEHYHERNNGRPTLNPEQTQPQRSPPAPPAAVRVILAGHSVGAYIALELVRLHHKQIVANQQRFNIKSCFLLTPTIVNLAQSKSGQIASPVLSTFPFFPNLVQLFASSLSKMVPVSTLKWLISRVTGMKWGSPGLETTTKFLALDIGVRQALHMAADELREMKEDKWGDEVWGSIKSTTTVTAVDDKDDKDNNIVEWKAPWLFMLFANEDHWIANETRQGIMKDIEERATKRKENCHVPSSLETHNDPVVVVDREEGLTHAWCLEQNEFVAQICKTWIRAVVNS